MNDNGIGINEFQITDIIFLDKKCSIYIHYDVIKWQTGQTKIQIHGLEIEIHHSP